LARKELLRMIFLPFLKVELMKRVDLALKSKNNAKLKMRGRYYLISKLSNLFIVPTLDNYRKSSTKKSIKTLKMLHKLPITD